MQKDKAIIFNTEVDLHLSTSWHYYIEIFLDESSNYSVKTRRELNKIFI